MPNVRTVRTYLHEITHGVRVLMSLADLNLIVDTRSARGEVCSFETRERKRVRVVETVKEAFAQVLRGFLEAAHLLPNPRDRAVSKNHWEVLVYRARSALRSLADVDSMWIVWPDTTSCCASSALF